MSIQDNLQAAFAGESQANRKYLAFAAKADAEGHPQIAKLFRAARRPKPFGKACGQCCANGHVEAECPPLLWEIDAPIFANQTRGFRDSMGLVTRTATCCGKADSKAPTRRRIRFVNSQECTAFNTCGSNKRANSTNSLCFVSPYKETSSAVIRSSTSICGCAADQTVDPKVAGSIPVVLA